MLQFELQLKGHVGLYLMCDAMPRSKVLIADKVYDNADLREPLKEWWVTPCFPPRRTRRGSMTYNKALHKSRQKIDNLFAKLKDCRRMTTMDDGCSNNFF